MELIDFSIYPASDVQYGGSERKEAILVPNGGGRPCEYMLKFRKRTPFGMRNNHLSEYLGSRIFEVLGYPTQKVFLGLRHGEEVVACKSFVADGKQFVPFNDVGESTLDEDKESYQYDYEDIMRMLRDNSKLTDVAETISMFWEMFIVDALLGNFDRHGMNWGFIKRDNAYALAPVFDNGSCLFPNMTDEDEMSSIVTSPEETAKRVYGFPLSQIKLRGRKSSYYEVINSLAFPECNRALEEVMGRIQLERIEALVGEMPISECHRAFYRHMIQARYHGILESSWASLGRRFL